MLILPTPAFWAELEPAADGEHAYPDGRRELLGVPPE